MNNDRLIDTTTDDFVDAANGAFAGCNAIDNMVALSFKIKRGSWEGDPLLGHRLGELDGATNTSANQLRAQDLVLDAVQWLMDAKLIANVVATVTDLGADVIEPGISGIAFELDYSYAGTGQNATPAPFLVATGAG